MKAEWRENTYGGWTLFVGKTPYVTMYPDTKADQYDAYLNGANSDTILSSYRGSLAHAKASAARAMLAYKQEVVAALEAMREENNK